MHLYIFKKLFIQFIGLSYSLNYIRLVYGVKSYMLFVLCIKILNLVTVNGFQSHYVCSDLGLMQGDVLSPILFSLYINDFEVRFIHGNCIRYE